MITFKQSLTEETQDLEDFIIEKCHWLLSELDADVEETIAKPLYRGINVSGDAQKIQLRVNGKVRTCLIKNVRQNREPLDTPRQISTWVDDAFEEIFGWKPRSQGLFCTGSLFQTTDYGQAFQIFPMGKFKYVWSPDITDMIAPIKRISRELKISYPGGPVSHITATKEQLAEFNERIREFITEKYIDENLHDAIGKHREIMFSCKQYLAVPL